MDHQHLPEEQVSELWRQFLVGGDSGFHRTQNLFRLLPSTPRCHVCYSPFGGAGGFAMRLIGRSPSRMNPRICGVCERFAEKHPGGAEVPLTLLFADIRGSTALAEKLGTGQFSTLIARFYDAVTEELVKRYALIDRLIGDEVIALFVPGLAGERHSEVAVEAAEGILRATGHDQSDGPWVQVGIGIHTGNAFVGSVGSAGVRDITALGDDVNLTARLASTAQAGEILITEATRAAAGLETEYLEQRRLDLKGRSTLVDVWLKRIGVNNADSGAGH